MRNVVINRLNRYIFTEEQLRGYWKRKNVGLTYEELTNEQIMDLAVSMMANSSHSALEQHTFEDGWRNTDDITGKMIAEDDTMPEMHVELIDTEQEGKASNVIIDRLLKMSCDSCDFSYYVEDGKVETSNLKCPACCQNVVLDQKQRVVKNDN